MVIGFHIILNNQFLNNMNNWLIIVCSLFFFSMKGQSIEISTSSDTILLGNYIELKVTIKDIEGEFSEPFIEGGDIISGPNVSSSVQIINGDKTSTQSYSYYIKPQDIGYVHIGPSSISNLEHKLETEPMELLVVPNPGNIIIEPEKDQSNNFFFDFNFGEPFGNKKKVEPQKDNKRKYKRI